MRDTRVAHESTLCGTVTQTLSNDILARSKKQHEATGCEDTQDNSIRPTFNVLQFTDRVLRYMYIVLAFPCSAHLVLVCHGQLTRLLRRKAASVPNADNSAGPSRLHK
ncbi:hypothetical protein BU25DRAFT_156893 [Macroventuria anomochaeta]|uniref:Uncharacterized protein n=1 Tax=Macroventuria anomochaeta TaxID=301207 RepID=A0ACB6RT19_9PLEO|nr:uncharacterized protein BU25DRAFT_156893 [Macroventuria anomochaeta]KAF2624278.1 hypothetical protein BU25DRAFT_156893 [Macroventuria anomochaeta]